jgi:hypothetical protein
MLDRVKGKKMTVEEAVKAGMKIIADIKARASENKDDALGFIPVFEAVRDANVIGKQECQALSMRVKTLAARQLAEWWELHSHLTLRCEAKGIDIPDVPDGGVHPLDGGPR